MSLRVARLRRLLPRAGRRTGRRGWSVRAHITGIVLIAAVVLLAAGWLLARSSLDTARDRGRHNAQFQAGLAAHAIADSFSQGQSAIAGLTGLDTRALLANP